MVFIFGILALLSYFMFVSISPPNLLLRSSFNFFLPIVSDTTISLIVGSLKLLCFVMKCCSTLIVCLWSLWPSVWKHSEITASNIENLHYSFLRFWINQSHCKVRVNFIYEITNLKKSFIKDICQLKIGIVTKILNCNKNKSHRYLSEGTDLFYKYSESLT